MFPPIEMNKNVFVPRALVLLEAFMRLHARDAGKQVGGFSLAMVDYILMYVDEDGFLDPTSLSEPIRTFYERLKGDERPIRQWTKELRIALGMSSGNEV